MTRGDSILELAADLMGARAQVNEMTAIHGPDSILTNTARLELKRLERWAQRVFS